MKFIAACLEEHGDWTMAELSRAFGISRKSAYKWRQRYETWGLEGLKDRSRAPKNHPNAVPTQVIERIIAVRRRHRFWGPRKIVAWLRSNEPGVDWPVVSTAGEILKRHGMVSKRRRRRLDAFASGLKEPKRPNDQWSADFKGWFCTADGRRCDPLTITDGFSRFLLRCRAVERPNETHTWAAFRSVFREYGLPFAIRTDNGTPFASVGLGRLTRLSAWWVKLGITLERIDPGKPQQNGRHERMHETLKLETARPPRANARAQQRAFEQFWYDYNFERPHEALRDRPPAQLYEPSARAYPERVPELEYPGHFRVRRVRRNGEIKWRGEFLYVNKALAGEPVGLEPLSDRHWRMVFGPVPLALVDDHTGQMIAYRVRRGLADKPEEDSTQPEAPAAFSSGGRTK
jgi:transposase InsO family protein